MRVFFGVWVAGWGAVFCGRGVPCRLFCVLLYACDEIPLGDLITVPFFSLPYCTVRGVPWFRLRFTGFLLVLYMDFTWGVFCVGGLVQRVGAGQWGVWCGGVVVIQSGGGRGWSRDPVSGVEVMPEKWALFLDWLLDGEGRVPSTQKDWAELNGVAASTVRKWKRDPRFVREWDRRATDLNVHPERTQSVVESLWRAASGGDVKAASLYLQYVEKFTPKRAVLVDDGRSVAGLSDVELAAELEQLVAEVRGGSGG